MSKLAEMDWNFDKALQEAFEALGEHWYWEKLRAELLRRLGASVVDREQLIALQLEHETSYNESSGRWYWSCKCGLEDSFIDWNECHIKTREHWAEKILGLIGGASAVDVKGLADEIVDWLNDNGAELTRTQLRQGVADLLRKHIALPAAPSARDDPRCKRCGYIRSLHSIEPPYDLDGPHGFYCPSFSYVDPPKAGSGWWKKNRKVYCTCGHFGENHDPEDGNCEVGPPCEKKCQRFDARDLQPLETGTGAGEQEEK